MYALCSVPMCAVSSVASTPCSQLHAQLVAVTHTWLSGSCVNGRCGNGRRLALAEPHPHEPAALDRRVAAGRDLGRERLGVRAVGGRVDDLAGDVDLPAVEDAPQPALLVAREHEGRVAVRAPLVEEPDVAVRVAEGHVVLADEAHAARRAVGAELHGEHCGDPAVLAHEHAHRGVTVDARQPLVLVVGQHRCLPVCLANRRVSACQRTPGSAAGSDRDLRAGWARHRTDGRGARAVTRWFHRHSRHTSTTYRANSSWRRAQPLELRRVGDRATVGLAEVVAVDVGDVAQRCGRRTPGRRSGPAHRGAGRPAAARGGRRTRRAG